tara:strand:+ start:2216 stop:2518 length:303 start_codon:yes stop_codon:yes gene_type:complete
MFLEFLDAIMEDLILEHTLQESMNSEYEDLFKRNDNVEVNLKKKVYQEEPIECKICLENISKDDLFYEIECSHIFHCDCLLNCLKHQHSQCPICRKKIKN